jgi:3-dehydroquinate synthase
MQKVRVGLERRSYDIMIGHGLIINSGPIITPLLSQNRVVVITDQNVAPLHLRSYESSMNSAGVSVSSLVLPSGEGTKSWKYVIQVVEWMLEQKVERNDLVVALGGGVIGDLVGFAAAILRRGVQFVQIPTSLLAQVDSSIGGKTGINVSFGKNLVGAFHQPSVVLADIQALDTLPNRDFLSGYGEVAKYGLLGDEHFFCWLEDNAAALIDGDVELRIEAVKRSCQIKAKIVENDEREQGERALLNLGHTFCHALEGVTNFSDVLLHGEGVSIGCSLAFDVSAKLGLCSQEAPSRVREHFKSINVATDISQINGFVGSADQIYDLMAQDKKVVKGVIRFILASDIGKAVVQESVSKSLILEVLQDSLER